jgi:arylsulfatase A-like enzyme
MKQASPLLLGKARAWWAAHQGRPRFAFVNLLDPHQPYRPPKDTFELFLPDVSYREAWEFDEDPVPYQLRPGLTPRQTRIVNQLYNAEIATMDRQIGAFLEWLRDRGDLDHTIVVITADHGEHLGERGILGHDLVLDPYVLRVPLIVRYPPKTQPSRITRRVQLDGVPGYVLHLAGLTAPPAMAQSALLSAEREIVRAQYQDPEWFVARLVRRNPAFDVKPYRGDWFFVADDRYAYSCAQGNLSSRVCSLNDMDEDPGWTRDTRSEHPDVLQRLQAVSDALPLFHPVHSSDVDPANAERLRSLGYVN